jgi:hypothetical protein
MRERIRALAVHLEARQRVDLPGFDARDQEGVINDGQADEQLRVITAGIVASIPPANPVLAVLRRPQNDP